MAPPPILLILASMIGQDASTTGPARPSDVAGPVNLLVDGSFETDRPPAWTAGSWRRSFRDYATEAWDAHDGERAAEIRVEGDPDDAMLLQVVAVKPRTRYRFSGWVMTSKVVIQEGGSIGANLSLPGRIERSASVSGDSDWSLLGFEFETDQEDQVRVAARLGHHSSTATGTAWFDGLSLIELGPSTRLARRLPVTPPTVRARPEVATRDWPALVPLGVSLLVALLALFALGNIVAQVRRLAKAPITPVPAREADEEAPGPPDSVGVPFVFGPRWQLAIGLGFLVVGALLVPAAILGLLGLPMVVVGPALVWIAVLQQGRSPGVTSAIPRLIGVLAIAIGSLGLSAAALFVSFAAGGKDGISMGPSTLLGLGASWLVSAGAILVGHRLRSPGDRRGTLRIAKAIGWAFVACWILCMAFAPGLPRSL